MIKTGKASRAIFMLVIFIMTLLIGFCGYEDLHQVGSFGRT